MAQLVARLVRNEKVGGSNPPSSTQCFLRGRSTSEDVERPRLASSPSSPRLLCFANEDYRRERGALGGVSWGQWVCPAQPLRDPSSSCGVGGAPMWCVKRRRVVSWLVVGRRGLHLGSWRAGSGCGGGPGRGRPGPRRFALVSFALVVGPGDGVGAQGGEGGQEHGALEPLVAAVGDVLAADR